MIKIYGTARCVNCKAVKQLLDRQQIPYEYIDVQRDEEAMSLLQSQGYQSFPVITDGSIWVHGYDISAILRLASKEVN